MILVDTREKPKAITKIIKYFEDNNIQYDSSKLYIGDYQNLDNPKVIIDRKQNLNEIMQNITQKRFRDELIRAKNAGIHLIILIEHSKDITCIDDISEKWENPRLKQYISNAKWKLHIKGDYTEWELFKMMRDAGMQCYRPPQSAMQLQKSLHTIENNKDDYDVEFRFCDKSSTGKVIVEMIERKINEK